MVLEQAQYPDYTKDFYDFILFDKSEVFKGETSKNRIKTKPILVMGTSGIGKTTTAMNIISRILSFYGKEITKVIYTNEVSLKTLMDIAFMTDQKDRGKFKVFVLVFDDATSVEVSPEEIRRFFSIRHLAEDRTGLKEGVVYSIMLTHDWFRLDKLFRRYSDNIIVLSAPALDTFAKRQCEKLIGSDAVKELQEIYRLAIRYDDKKGTGFVKIPFSPIEDKSVGYFKFSNVAIPEYIEIKSKEADTPIEIDENTKIVYVHENKHPELKPITTLEEATAYKERQKELNRSRVRKFRERKKQEIQEALADNQNL